MAEKDAVMEIIEKALGELEGPLDGGTSNKAILDRIQVRHEGLTEPPTVPDQISLLLKIAEKAAKGESVQKKIKEKIKALEFIMTQITVPEIKKWFTHQVEGLKALLE